MKINKREYKKLVEENGGLHAIIFNAVREHNIEWLRKQVFGKNEDGEKIAISMYVDSRMGAINIVKKLIK